MKLCYFNVKRIAVSASTLTKKVCEMELLADKRNVSAEKAMAMLKNQGVTLNPEDAALVVDFLYMLADILISEPLEA